MGITIYVPGRGRVDLDEIAVDTAVREYDERLSFTFDYNNGHYAVFIKNVLGQPPFPIFAFPQGIPSVDAVIKRLYETDAVRHGTKLLDDINRRNAAVKREQERAAEEADGIAAEAMEWFARTEGHTNYHKSTRKVRVPGGDA
jgi:hypothetical protein